MLRARVDVLGQSVAYRQWGTAEAPVLLLAHGLPDGAFAWTKVAEGLADIRRIVALDLPGFGDSPAPRGADYSMAHLTALLDGFVEALSLGRFDLGVHDIAGAYAVAMAGRRPEAVGQLVVMNSNSFTGWRWHALARRVRRPVLGRLILSPVPRAVFVRLLAPGFAGAPPDWYVDETWKGWRRGAARRAMFRFYRSNDAGSWAEAESALAALRGKPALVVWGDRDPFVSSAYADRYAEALGATVVRLPDAGHFPMVERPDDVVAALRPFLQGP